MAKTPHRWHTSKGASWMTYCLGCGHMPLKNYISELVTKIGCDFDEDPRYQAWLRQVCKVKTKSK